MSYISTDFDNLNAGINILDIEETETSLLPYEGTYSDKGKGYKQQYVSLNVGFYIPHLVMDFCFIFKDGYTTTNVTNLNFNYTALTDFTPTVTTDSNNNVVWLYEDIDTWDLNDFLNNYGFFNWKKGNQDLYYYVHSSTEIDNKQPDEFDVVRFVAESTNLTFEAQRYSPTSSDLVIKFNGTYYNGSLGLVNNALQSIEIYHIDDSLVKVTDKVLVQNTDFTIDDNKIYSGTSSTPTPITVSTGILYNQKKNVFIEVVTTANTYMAIYMITKGIPICNWKEGEFYINGDLIVRDEDGENGVNLLNCYSTNETKIGYWIDGKPLYRQVQNIGTITGQTNGTAISNLKQAVKIWGVAYSSQYNQWYNIPNVHATIGSYYINVLLNGTTPQVRIGSSIASLENVYVFIEYTKTTDYPTE